MSILMIPVPALGTVESFETTTMHAATTLYAVEYGLKQSIADSYASVTKKTHPDATARRAARKVLADKRIAQLRSGNVPGSTYVATAVDTAIAESGMTTEEAAAIIRAAVAAKKKKVA